MSAQSRLASLITALGTDYKAIQTALAGKVSTTRTVNGQPLSSNVTLAAGDVGAVVNGEGGMIRIHKTPPSNPVAGVDYWIDDGVT